MISTFTSKPKKQIQIPISTILSFFDTCTYMYILKKLILEHASSWRGDYWHPVYYKMFYLKSLKVSNKLFSCH